MYQQKEGSQRGLEQPVHMCLSAGVYKPEPLGDMWWALLSTGILFLYHFLFLQVLGLVRQSPLLGVT